MDAISCSRCPGRKFKDPKALHFHKINAKGHSYCAACQSDFADSTTLLEHATATHPGTACITCRRLFDASDVLERHFAESPRHPKCELCRLGFPDKAAARAHKEEIHPSSKNTRKREKKEQSSDGQSRSPSPFSDSGSCSTVRVLGRFAVSASPPPASFEWKERHDLSPLSSSPPQGGTEVAIDFATEFNEEDCDIASQDISNKIKAEEIERDRAPDSTSSEEFCAQDGDKIDSLLDELADLKAELVSFSLLDGSGELPLDTSADVFFGSKVNPFRQQWDQSPYLSSPRSISATRLPLPLGSSSLSPFSKLTRPGLFADTEVLPDDRMSDSEPAGTRPIHDSWHVSRPSSISSSMRYSCGILSPSSREMRPRLNLSTSLTTIRDEPEPEADNECDENSAVEQIQFPISPQTGHDLLFDSPNDWRSEHNVPLESIDERSEEEDGVLSSPSSPNESKVLEPVGSEYGVEFSRVPSIRDDEVYSTEDETGDSEHSFCPSAPPALVVEDLTRLALDLGSPTSDAAYSEDNTDSESIYFDPFDLHPSRTASPVSATFPKRPRAWSFGHDCLRVPDFASDHCGDDEHMEVRGQHSPPIEEERDVGIDEEALALDEAPPADIETDLFLDEDAALNSDMPHDPASPVTAFESFPSEQSSFTAIGDMEHHIPTFAEDDHPLKSLITLDTVDNRRYYEEPAVSHAERLQSSPSRNLDELTPALHDGSSESSPAPITQPEDGARLPFMCRICHKPPPLDNVSATFCGHIFCRPCITDEVMSTSKCPVCSSPTLLYCIFKLDLGP